MENQIQYYDEYLSEWITLSHSEPLPYQEVSQ